MDHHGHDIPSPRLHAIAAFPLSCRYRRCLIGATAAPMENPRTWDELLETIESVRVKDSETLSARDGPRTGTFLLDIRLLFVQ